MRTFDLSPFYRSTVGFDRLFSMLDQLPGFEGGGSPYPPYISSGPARTPIAYPSRSRALRNRAFDRAKENTLTSGAKSK